jgi:hypothetical protein
MNPCCTPLRRILLLAGALVLTGLTARPGAAQRPCRGVIPINDSVQCKLAGDSVWFGGSSSGTMDFDNDSLYLGSGWVYLAPVNSGGGNRADVLLGGTAPVKVSTTYSTASAGSADTLGMDSSATMLGASNKGSFLVLVSIQNGGTTPDTTVSIALVAGSMITPSLQPGCQITYKGGQTTSLSNTVRNTLNGIPAATNIPVNCFMTPCPSSILGAGNTACTLGGYNAVFGSGTIATIDVDNDSITLSSGTVFLTPGGGGNSSVTLATGYMETDSVAADSGQMALDTVIAFGVSSNNASFFVQSFGADSVSVGVTSGNLAIPNIPQYIQLQAGYQADYYGAGYRRAGVLSRSPISGSSTTMLCGLGAYPMKSPQCP